MPLSEMTAVKKVGTNLSSASDSRKFENEVALTTIEAGYDRDVLSQFKANLQQVEELNLRLKYVLGEVSQLLSKRG